MYYEGRNGDSDIKDAKVGYGTKINVGEEYVGLGTVDTDARKEYVGGVGCDGEDGEAVDDSGGGPNNGAKGMHGERVEGSRVEVGAEFVSKIRFDENNGDIEFMPEIRSHDNDGDSLCKLEEIKTPNNSKDKYREKEIYPKWNEESTFEHIQLEFGIGLGIAGPRESIVGSSITRLGIADVSISGDGGGGVGPATSSGGSGFDTASVGSVGALAEVSGSDQVVCVMFIKTNISSAIWGFVEQYDYV
ncbi:hypothetical protein VNO77_02250 [Canavalia gladiata]|uniref:Uncharacterized protein n=1 Tax=Canavalia gladiata TaxID=3824 RepID=A0AAN9MTA4_CANGL